METVECADDVGDWQEPPVHGGNYSLQRNRHLSEFSSADNDPSTWFADIRASYTTLHKCTVLLNESLSAAMAPPAQSVMEIVQEHAKIERYLQEAVSESQAFYNTALLELREEMDRISGVNGEMEE